ncbi:MAG: hypothetical protein ABIF10_07545 [Candidatus Woesearchaeota archaeon]
MSIDAFVNEAIKTINFYATYCANSTGPYALLAGAAYLGSCLWNSGRQGTKFISELGRISNIGNALTIVAAKAIYDNLGPSLAANIRIYAGALGTGAVGGAMVGGVRGAVKGLSTEAGAKLSAIKGAAVWAPVGAAAFPLMLYASQQLQNFLK